MPRGCCRRHGSGETCTCVPGNVYRFVEPVLLYLLKARRCAYGYELLGALAEESLTGAEVDSAVLYRTLRQLEETGMVVSEWDVAGSGPARRRYQLTPAGLQRLDQWSATLERMAGSMLRFVEQVRSASSTTPCADQAPAG